MNAPIAAISAGGKTLGILAAAAILAACGELQQDGPKPFVTDGTYGSAAAPDARARDKGLAERASLQDEYVLLEENSKVALSGGGAR